ncbi:hypothetical protein GCM10010270_86480 [Streptomyces violaceus]|nr:hypothetical protein GCM10010270_86480 [Streptomyces janthinus]
MPIEVKAIIGGEVKMVAPLTGSGYSVSGCSGGGAVSSEGSGGVGFSCDEGPAATVNDAMSLEVVEMGADHARTVPRGLRATTYVRPCRSEPRSLQACHPPL